MIQLTWRTNLMWWGSMHVREDVEEEDNTIELGVGSCHPVPIMKHNCVNLDKLVKAENHGGDS